MHTLIHYPLTKSLCLSVLHIYLILKYILVSISNSCSYVAISIHKNRLYTNLQKWIPWKLCVLTEYFFSFLVSKTRSWILRHIFFFPFFLLNYSWFIMLWQFLLYNNVNQLYIYIHSLSYNIFQHSLPQETVYSSLCCRVGTCCLSIPNAIVCIYQPQTPSPSPSLTPPLWQPKVLSLRTYVFSLKNASPFGIEC